MSSEPGDRYRVDSIHLNIGVGDSAIHLLVKYHDEWAPEGPPSKKVRAKPTIFRACLIDGGEGCSFQKIDNAIKKIEEIYRLPPNQESLKFDSVVITHWDTDHYKGIVDLVNDKLTEEINKLLKTKKKKRGQLTSEEKEGIQVPFFKYGGAGRSSPQTTFYAPYWHGDAGSFKAPRDSKLREEQKQKGIGKPKTPKRPKPKNPGKAKPTRKLRGVRPRWLAGRKEGAGAGAVTLLDFTLYKFQLSSTNSKHNKLKSTERVRGICKLHYDPARMIGTNFFDNTVPKDFNYQLMKSPADLADKVFSNAQIPVGMFCVACCNRAIRKENELFTIENGSSTATPFVIDEKNSSPNWASIGAIVLWRDSKRVSHYFAGDSWYRFEDHIVEWIKNGLNPKNSETLVASVKLSHHGSYSSTPTKMIDVFNPTNIVVSAGKQKTKPYGHPAWETLLYLNFWKSSQTGNKLSKPVLCTEYPYYCAYVGPQNNKNKIFPDLKDKGFGKWREFVQGQSNEKGGAIAKEVKTYLDAIDRKSNPDFDPGNLDFQGIVKLARDWWRDSETKLDENTRPWNCRAWLAHQIYEAWEERLSPITFEDHSKVFMIIIAACSASPEECEVLLRDESGSIVEFEKDDNSKIPPTAPKKPLSDGFMPELWWNPNKKEGDSKDQTTYKVQIRKSQVSAMAEDPTSPGHWFASSAVPVEENMESIQDRRLNNFTLHLHEKKFGVTSKPQGSAEIGFLPDDEWYSWLKESVLATNFLLMTGKSGGPAGFRLELSIPKITQDGGDAPLTFDTSLIESSFRLPSGEKTPELGLLGERSIMVMGLDMNVSGAIRTDLSKALSYAGMGSVANSRLVQFIGVDAELSLQPKKSEGARNAVWFEPIICYRNTVRLQWDFVQLEKVQNLFDHIGLEVKKANLTTLRKTSWASTSCMVRMETLLKLPTGDELLGSVALGQHMDNVVLVAEKSLLDPIVEWLSGLIKEDFNFGGWLADITTNIAVRRINLELNIGEGKVLITNWVVDVEMRLNLGGGPIVLATYAKVSRKRNLEGRLWFTKSEPFPPTLNHTYKKSNNFTRIFQPDKEYLDLTQLVPGGVHNVPKQIPTNLTEIELGIGPESITFRGIVQCQTPEYDISKIPPIKLDEVYLDAMYTFGGTDQKGNLELLFQFALKLYPESDLEESDLGEQETLGGDISYDSRDGGQWTVEACIGELTFEDLADFFDPEVREQVSSVLGNLVFSELDLTYEYRGGIGSGFTFKGVLVLGDLELDVTYEYSSKGWKFYTQLGTNAGQTKLSDIVHGILGEDEKYSLPSFVGDISVGSDAIILSCHRQEKEKSETPPAEEKGEKEDLVSDSYFFFTASIKFVVEGNTLDGTFIQYHDLSTKTAPTKRILKIPAICLQPVTVPVVGDLTQPFDEMFYLWVQTGKNRRVPATTERLTGLEDREVKDINISLASDEENPADKLVFKDVRKEKNPTDVVITTGSHFVLVEKLQGKPEVIIDYAFSAENERTLSLASGSEAESTTDDSTTEDSATEDSETEGSTMEEAEEPETSGGEDAVMAPFIKSVGPISISNIGLKYKGGVLSILLDAAFLMGPICFDLNGFSLNIDLTGSTIQDINLKEIHVALAGMAVSFDRAPVRVAGAFVHTNDTREMNVYTGGIMVSFTPYQFTAAGMYGEVKEIKIPDKNEAFKTAFVFAEHEGPQVTLEFAEISGITGGFGYNSDIKFPTVAEVPEFPFVGGTGVDGNIMTTLENLIKTDGTGWFKPSDGSLWLAAGLKVTAFETLSVDAIVVVSWNPTIRLGVFGVGTFDIPKATEVKFAHVELGISAVVDFAAGVMKFEAQLSPQSYIFDPSCHLTGGFALYYWFEGSGSLEGDWVCTIGGFHRAYNRPSHYPNPPRLAITWQVDKNVDIIGEAYFAITPKCCMGGGHLRVTVQLGPIRAWFEAWTDFLLNYRPFHFNQDMGISIWVTCAIDLLITSIVISAEIGATLHLEGPPFCGRLHVNLWVMSFNVNFGPEPKPPGPISLQEFYEVVQQSDKQAASVADFVMTSGEQCTMEESADKKAHVFSCSRGMIEGNGKDAKVPEGAQWKVRSADFVFAVSSRFAFKTATVKTTDDALVMGDAPTDPGVSCNTPIYAKPMHLTEELSSELEVRITRDQSMQQAILDIEDTSDVGSELAVKSQWKIEDIVKAVPTALWGKYDPSEDPQRSGASGLLNGDNSVVKLMMGVTLKAPEPQLSPDLISTFNAVAAMRENVFGKAHQPTFPAFRDEHPDWRPNEPELDDKPWERVEQAWRQGPEKIHKRQETVDRLMKAMHWKKGLVSATPERLLEHFGDLYLAAPLISAGG